MGTSTLDLAGRQTPAEASSICVVGLGNVLWTDEGFGIRCVETLQRRYLFSPRVRLVEAGSRQLHLMPDVRRARHLLIFDTIDYGLMPGALRIVQNDEVPGFMVARKLSRRQSSFDEVAELARCLDQPGKQVVLIGCQPEENGMIGMSLRPRIKHALRDAVAYGVQLLATWNGMPCFVDAGPEHG